jgi:hypothetical protein
MTTGLDLSKLFDDKIDNSYSDYVSAPKKQRAFDNAFLRIIENKYRGMDTQKEFDELSELIVIDKEFDINNNRFRTTPAPIFIIQFGTPTIITFFAEHNLEPNNTFRVQNATFGGLGVAAINTTHVVATPPATPSYDPKFSVELVTPIPLSTNYDQSTGEVIYDKMLSDYLHLLAMKCRMYTNAAGEDVYRMYVGTPGTIEFFTPVALRDGERIIFNQVASSITAPIVNSEAYIKRVSEFKYELYSDEHLISPLAIAGSYSRGTTVKEIEYSYGKYYPSDRRISHLGLPTIEEPKYNQSDNFFKVFPSEHTCDKVKVDYIRRPTIAINVTDTILDLENFYSDTLMNRLTDEAVKMFYQQVRDPNQYTIADREMIDNP